MNFQEFASLDQEAQKKVFRETPYKEKGELLLHSHNPKELTRALSLEELYLVTKGMDAEERGEILRYANLPQIMFLGDIDCWKKDRIDPRGMTFWIESLIQADPRILLVWMTEADYATVVAGLKKLIRVTKPEWEYVTDDALGDTPVFTLDQFYYICAKEENLEIIRQAMQILYENHRGRYVALLEALIGEIDDILEEEAYQRRQLRLSERGFPDPETARKVYRPLEEGEWEKFPKKNPNEGRNATVREARLAHYPVLRLAERLLLDQVLLLLQEESYEVREGIEEELAWLSNKIVASDGIDFSSEERILQGINRARSLVNLGLELSSGGDLMEARSLVKERWLELIFRRAVTELVSLREEAAKIAGALDPHSKQRFVNFLNPPYDSVFRGLLRVPVSQCYDAAASRDLDFLRDFRTREDVQRTRKYVVQVDKTFSAIRNHCPAALERVSNGGNEPALFLLLGTLFAGFVIKDEPVARALSVEEVKCFLEKGFRLEGKRRLIDPGKKEAFLSRLMPGEDRELVAPLWALIFDRIEDEFSHLKSERFVDPRFIASIWIQPNGKKSRAAGNRKRPAVKKR